MANPEHLKILKRGVKAWNKWRKENPYIKPNLSGADLRHFRLNRANLEKSDLRRVNLKGAWLVDAHLHESNLNDADLGPVALSRAIVAHAKLKRANLHKAELQQTDFYGSDLTEADLSEADAPGAFLLGANLSEAKLNRAGLTEACFAGAELRSAKLIGAILWRADLRAAHLEKADLREADLTYSTLVSSDLSEAVLTGTKLYGSGRDNWNIKDVKCEYVYWDEEGEQRSPKDRDLEPGEFERLYVAVPTIEYIFEHGMSPIDPLIMDRVVQAIREKRPEFDIKIDSINARGLAPSVKFTVRHEEHKEPALEEVRRGYEAKIAQLEAERDRYWEVIKTAFDKPREVKLITAGPGAIVATDGSTVNIQQHIHNALELQKAIAAEPEKSESFARVAKKTALDIIGGAIKDIAKGQVKEAAKQIVELGKDLGPLFVKMAPAAYEFFKNMVT